MQEKSEIQSSSLIEQLREIRFEATRLSGNILKQLEPFQKQDDSFKTLPDSGGFSKDPKISVGSTCTVLMALCSASRETELVSKGSSPSSQDADPKKVDVRDLFTRVVEANWGSSGLPDGNAFTTALVVRTAGFLVDRKIFKPQDILQLTHGRHEDNDHRVDESVAGKALSDVIKAKVKLGPSDAFAVNGYPAKSTIAYWFVDGVIRTGLKLDEDDWIAIASWAKQEFYRQLVYLSAHNDSLMDPPELAMAACLIKRIHHLCIDRPELLPIIGRTLPTEIELTHAIENVLSQQSESGIWHKYFPLFHFPLGGGAADYCFSFEYLEAILKEFGASALRKHELVDHFSRAVVWCDRHVLHFVGGGTGTAYRGWNSGGEVRKLAAGMPEAWATATVHMFFFEIQRAINELLDVLILKRFGTDRVAVEESTKKLDSLIDVSVSFPGEPETTLLTVLKEELISTAASYNGEGETLGVPRSALLFGPPGTSKSRLAKSIASYLGWPIVIITPSEFLGKGLEQVHGEVDEKFRDLMDLRRVVVFFDEMDALAQTREENPAARKDSLDVTRLLLTTSMLPKLADLWDKKQVVFLMATNHKQQLDPAITRANRFDLLLCVAPPPWARKRSAKNLDQILGIQDAADVERELIRLVETGSGVEKLLDLFTVSELGIFFDHVRRALNQERLLPALRGFESAGVFSSVVTEWAVSGIVLRDGGLTKREYEEDVKQSRRQYHREEGQKKD